MIVRAQITSKWAGQGYVPVDVTSVTAYSVDTALDTDTDSWNIQFGDLRADLIEMVNDRDAEVRVNIFGVGRQQTQALNTGFADEIIFSESNMWTVNGRDFTAVAVDSQHPPQVWRHIRPHALVANEARKLKIGGSLDLAEAPGFKSYSTDGSETWWQVWYRFYRKRKMWLYAEPDGTLVAGPLNYNQASSYHFGVPTGMNSLRAGQTWIPVERMEWRADKSQRVGEVYVFGHNHHGKVGFVAHEKDSTVKQWVKKPTRIYQSADVHNAAEARQEAIEEIFESKVGTVEIKLTIASPGFVIQQNKMATVNIPKVGLRGDYFVVGVTVLGSVSDGVYQVVRLREKDYAISRRVPISPRLSPGPSSTSSANDIASGLDVGAGDTSLKTYFVDAATKFHGPWPFQLFLAVLLSIAEKESNFLNVRESSSIQYPGTYPGIPSGSIPTPPTQPPLRGSENWERFEKSFSNDVDNSYSPWYGKREAGVGIMQLTTKGYKLLADRQAGKSSFGPSPIDQDVLGGRWSPQWNIWAGAAALASKIGAGVSISPEGQLRSVPVSGLSLNPTPENIWAGVAAYNGTGPDAQAYSDAVRAIYESNYKTDVEAAVSSANATGKREQVIISSKNGLALQNAVLNNSIISFNPGSEKTERNDISTGQIDPRVLKFLIAFTDAGFPVVIWALKNDHTHLGKGSAHAWGLAVDLGNYSSSNPETRNAMTWIRDHQDILGFAQLIGFDPSLTVPPNYYDAGTMNDHQSHIHVGWPCPECPKYK